MKKLAFLFAAVVAVSFASCGENTPAEARNYVDEQGCAYDSDQDGVYDYMDECPETPAVARNFVDSVGCFLDTDGDGVYDYEDQCPTIAGVKANLGCPEIKREVRNLLKKAMSGIQFENAKATIKPNSYKILNDIAKIFIDNPTYIVEVQGHTDNVGKYDYNMDLSERRAQAVRTYLINQGVPAERLTAHGYGPDRPIDDNKTKAGRAKNRRVEFNITFEEVTYETVYDRVQNNNNQQEVNNNNNEDDEKFAQTKEFIAEIDPEALPKHIKEIRQTLKLSQEDKVIPVSALKKTGYEELLEVICDDILHFKEINNL